ncbi:MAG: hypothetical protein ACE5GD_00835 [Candidatus Geothermarchaeales archaeon]
MSDVFNLFLHVVFALLGLTLWVLGSLILFVMFKTGRFAELGKPTASIFIVGGLLFVLMQIFGSLVYQPYDLSVRGFLDENFPYMSYYFNLKLLFTSLATILGFGAAAGAWIAESKRDVYLISAMSITTLALFAICAYLAVLVTSTRSI